MFSSLFFGAVLAMYRLSAGVAFPFLLLGFLALRFVWCEAVGCCFQSYFAIVTLPTTSTIRQ